jgi:hypothetical protein
LTRVHRLASEEIVRDTILQLDQVNAFAVRPVNGVIRVAEIDAEWRSPGMLKLHAGKDDHDLIRMVDGHISDLQAKFTCGGTTAAAATTDEA